jgi:yecA family protein
MKMFTAKEKNNIEHVLSKVNAPKDELTIEEFHGLLFGIAITPELILPGEWIPAVFDDHLHFDNELDTENGTGYLIEAYNRMADAGNNGKLAYPFDFTRLAKADYPLIESWTHGLFMGLSLRPHIWQVSEENEKDYSGNTPPDLKKVKDSYDVIMTIALPEERVGIYEPIPGLPQIGPDEILAMLFIMLPAAVEILKNYGTSLKKGSTGAKLHNKKTGSDKSSGG